MLLIRDTTHQPVGHPQTTGVRLIRNKPNRTLRHLREVDTKGMNPIGITKRVLVATRGVIRCEEKGE
jgi:hypothetical protein